VNDQWGVPLDFSRIKTFPLRTRRNLVAGENLADPAGAVPSWEHPEFEELAERLGDVCRLGGMILWSMGAHVIKAGLGPYVSDLLDKGLLGHVAGNGAVAIHDFELALVGGTSEDVADALERGVFGMWEETGRYMNEAIVEGVRNGWGYGRAIGAFMDRRPDLFPYREFSVVWHAYRARVPFTIHVTIGADIVHQHPTADFAAIGEASGRDFKIYCRSVCELEGGAFLNFGSAVTGPEVFLKALSIVRNLGHSVRRFVTANFDVFPLGDYRNAVVDDRVRPEYFYRPWKNIVVRPPSLGGKGFHIEGDHRVTVPAVHACLVKAAAPGEGTGD